ncbi:MAG: hypothetical protein AUK47_24275 [Deltaproteobacteria bacterium CG2_30_63_29]|nr:MAG: hypothetical protein AUK47_24275 [Deltaproteobacteria bacterium CG2_30_63_29]PIV98359.1 MAG: hypothetical protein COW42_15035 [Deltaproteobacteria bacterium CG17_big_fil_post_rev_8_21_14_2_50_63_7]
MIEGVPTAGQEDGQEPMRRCVSCRSEDSKARLLRFVVVGSTLCFDARQRLPGRGMQVCASRICLERAAKGAFQRGAQRSDIELPTSSDWIDESIVSALRRLYEEVISSGRISGQLVVGSEAVTQAAKDNELVAYLVAVDASQGTMEKLEANARRKGLPVKGLLDRQAMSRLIGRENTVISGWKAGRLHDRFMVLEAQLRGLAGASAPVGEERQRETDSAETDDRKEEQEVDLIQS